MATVAVITAVYLAFMLPFVDDERVKVVTPNDSSSATRRMGRNDCNRDAPAGFAAAHG